MKLTSTAATTKLESKKQDTKETVKGMKGRKSYTGFTLSFMCFAMLHPSFINAIILELCAFAVLWLSVRFGPA